MQNVTIAGSLVYVRNDSVNITGSSLTLSGGTISIGSGGSLNFSGTQTLGGTGSVNFTEGSINVTNGGKLTIAAGITLQGNENDAYNTNLNANSGIVDNLGTIIANATGGQAFSITSGPGGSWTNDGTLEATAGGNLNLTGSWTNDDGHAIIVNAASISFNGSWSNLGTLSSQGDSSVNLGGNFTLATLGSYSRDTAGKDQFVIAGTLNLTGHTLGSSTSPGKWALNRGSIIGGTIATTLAASAYGTVTDTLQDVALAGTLSFPTNDTINVTGAGLSLSGAAIHLDNGGALDFSGLQSLSGNGSIQFTEGSINLTGSNAKLTIAPGITLDGNENDVYNTNLNANSGTIDVQGTIDADVGGGAGFSITSGTGGSWANDGTLEATVGGHLKLNGTWTNDQNHLINILDGSVSFNGSWSNQGTFTSQGESVAYLGSSFSLATLGSYTRDSSGQDTFVINGTLNLAGEVLDSGAGPGKWVLDSALVKNGTIANTIDTNDAGSVGGRETSTFQDVKLAGTLKFDSNDALNIGGAGLAVSGATINLDNGGSLNFSGTQALSGNGIVTFTEGSINLSGNPSALTIASGITLDGKEGDVYNTNINGHSGTVDNQGTIDADSGGGAGFSITSDTGGTWINEGTLEATSGGNLKVNVAVTNTGSIIARRNAEPQ